MFANQRRFPDIFLRGPFPQEKFTQERVERLLLTAKLLAATAVLLVESAQEPFKNQQRSLLGVGLSSRRHEDRRMLGPVGGIFGQGCGGKDERWSCQGGQITIERGDGLGSTRVSSPGRNGNID